MQTKHKHFVSLAHTRTETAHKLVLMPQLAILIQQRSIVAQLTHVVTRRRHTNVCGREADGRQQSKQ
jgi:hypothetical protein